MFLDADKPGYVTYLRHAIRLLRGGGILLADNVLADGAIADPKATSPTVLAIRQFLAAVEAESRLRSIIVPLGDGCLFGIRQE